MTKDYVCSKCKKTGDKNIIPYKIIKETVNKDDTIVKFIGQLCEDCYKEIFNQNEQKETTKTTE